MFFSLRRECDNIVGSQILTRNHVQSKNGCFVRILQLVGPSYIAKVWIHLVGMYLELLTFDFQKRYWNLYQQPSLPLFFELIRNWFILHITRMITYVYEFYVEDIFLLHWRDHLTRYFEAIWVPNTYVFKMKEGGKLDNPDQRIHVDTANFVTQTYSLTFGVMKMLLNLLMYSYMLMSITPTQMHPGSLVAIAFLYSALGSMTIHLMGSKLAHFSWLGERCGGDFRSELRYFGRA
jgi:putative ATP-binding cassette transporter